MPENSPVDAAPSPEISIKRALQTIADQINDGTSLTVETKVQVITTAGGVQVTGQPVTVARTEISIDGDRAIVVPIMLDTGELTVPQAVYDLHERHVSDAQLYRKELLNTLVDFVRNRR
jgi:hypothetical protein